MKTVTVTLAFLVSMVLGSALVLAGDENSSMHSGQSENTRMGIENNIGTEGNTQLWNLPQPNEQYPQFFQLKDSEERVEERNQDKNIEES